MQNKKQKVVIISGCTSGIGKELCKLYRADGHIVIGLARGAADGNDFALDVTDFTAVETAVDAVYAKYGRIDTVIANAGAGLSGATELLPQEAVERQIDLNFYGALGLVRSALKHMRRGGNVVVISSACALFALPYRSVYCASKAAINMAAFGLYMELKPHGIRVSAICPGDIKTGFTKNRVKYADGGERYGDGPMRAAQKIDSRENLRMDVGSASRRIYKCCEKCAKPMYIIGFKYKLLNALRHIMPQKLLLDMTAKLF